MNAPALSDRDAPYRPGYPPHTLPPYADGRPVHPPYRRPAPHLRPGDAFYAPPAYHGPRVGSVYPSGRYV